MKTSKGYMRYISLQEMMIFGSIVSVLGLGAALFEEELSSSAFLTLHMIVSAISLLWAAETYDSGEKRFSFAFGVLVLLFNPFLPPPLNRGGWRAFDIIAVGVFCSFALFKMELLDWLRSSPKHLRRALLENVLLCLPPMLLLLKGSIDPEDHEEQFQLLRLIVSVFSAALMIRNYKADRKRFTFVFGVLLVLFNPIFTMRLESENWYLLEIIAIGIFLFFLLYQCYTMKKVNAPKVTPENCKLSPAMRGVFDRILSPNSEIFPRAIASFAYEIIMGKPMDRDRKGEMPSPAEMLGETAFTLFFGNCKDDPKKYNILQMHFKAFKEASIFLLLEALLEGHAELRRKIIEELDENYLYKGVNDTERERGHTYRIIFVEHFKERISVKAEFAGWAFWQTAFEIYPDFFNKHTPRQASSFVLYSMCFDTIHNALEEALKVMYPDIVNAPMNVVITEINRAVVSQEIGRQKQSKKQ